ncbi:NB-ARC domain-containing protein, partial [Photobacterium sp. OFAV2-7]|uniref:NB-ARC domain-containing protein n=1 Tax=Photobacterium sp. OFAV2-7 TaxID=2917748 RepID=UPI001EF4C412
EFQENWVIQQLHNNSYPPEHPDFDKYCPNWSDVIQRLLKKGLILKPLALSDSGKLYAEEFELLNPRGIPVSPDFKVHVAPIATGAAVVEDEKLFARLSSSMRKVLGVDMETSALGSIGEINDIPVIVAKAVSDFGDDFKDDRYRHFASQASARAVMQFLKENAALFASNSIGKHSKAFSTDLVDDDRYIDMRVFNKPTEDFITNAPVPHNVFIGREQDITEVLEILSNKKNKIAVVRGWPGVGKTSLLLNIANHSSIKNNYVDGVLWTSLGQKPDIMGVLAEWGGILGDNSISEIPSIPEAIRRLQILLRKKRMLLVVDDVWEVPNGEVFRQLAVEDCQIVFSTRETVVAENISQHDCPVFVLRPLTPKDAFKVFTVLAPEISKDWELEVKKLLAFIENLPLAIHVAAGMLKTEQSLGEDLRPVFNSLEDGMELLSQDAPSDMSNLYSQTRPTVALLLEKSTSRLSETMRGYFAAMGAFAHKPAHFDVTAFSAVLGISDYKPIIRELTLRGLLEVTSEQRYQMHALLATHAEAILDSYE